MQRCEKRGVRKVGGRGKICLLVAALFVLPIMFSGPAQAAVVHAIRVEGPITPSVASYIAAAIKKAEEEKAEALVIELDTPGGYLESTRDIVKEMLASPVPILVYVSPSGARAASAGAFITLAGHVAAMAPGTHMGASTPVSGTGEEMGKTMQRKAESDAAASMRAIAEKRGRNVKEAERFVREAKSVTEKEALSLKLIDLVSPSLAELLAGVNGRTVETSRGKVALGTKEATVQRGEMNLRERILTILSDPTVAYIFFILGLAGIYFEFWNPGAIFPGVLGGIFLILAFYSFQTLPINYAGLLLILLAIALFIAEIKVASYGLLTLGGIVSLVLGSLMLIDRSVAPFLRISVGVIVGTALGAGAFFTLIMGAAVKALKAKPLAGREGLVGEMAVVRTALSPTGQVFVHGELWSAECPGGAEVGAKVRVVGIEGLRLIVERVESATPMHTSKP